MMYYTHLAFGLLVSLIALKFLAIKNQILFILIVLLFSILPDIDETRSKIGRKNKLISKTINFAFGHRGLIHTIYIPLIIFLIFDLINFEIAIATLIGYFSHLFSDALTKRGIRPLYPLINKRLNGPIRTGSLFEKILFLIIVLLTLWLTITFL